MNRNRIIWLLGNLLLVIFLGVLNIFFQEAVDSLNNSSWNNIFLISFFVWNIVAWIFFVYGKKNSGDWNMYAITSFSLAFLSGAISLTGFSNESHLPLFLFGGVIVTFITMVFALMAMRFSQKNKKGKWLAVVVLFVVIPLFLLELSWAVLFLALLNADNPFSFY